jgi:glycosyltransferase involved in cell wall biosynthesis
MRIATPLLPPQPRHDPSLRDGRPPETEPKPRGRGAGGGPSAAAIIPAYNEGPRIGAVLQTLVEAGALDEIVVVNDGSQDDTLAVARSFPEVTSLDLEENRGKGGAIRAGALHTHADVILLLDADLIGLRVPHIRDLLDPILSGEADMTVGVFRGGRFATDLSQFLVPYISGQRALRRDLFLAIPGIGQSRFGVETAMTRHAKASRLRVRNVVMQGVTHPMKEEKIGLLPGAYARIKMYREIALSLLPRRTPKA